MEHFTLQEKEAAVQLIKNMKMVNDIYYLTCKTQDYIFEKIGNELKAWCEDKNFYFENGYENSNVFWCAENAWNINSDKPEFLSRYEFGAYPDLNNYWLVNLVGENQSEYMVSFNLNRISFNKYHDLSMSKAQFIRFLNEFNNSNSEIANFGIYFEPQEGYWYVEFKLEPNELAEAFVNGSIEDALQPMHEAFETMYKAHKYFKMLVEKAENAFSQ